MLLYISGEMTGLSSREGGFESLQECQTKKDYGGRSSIWLEFLTVNQEVVGSIPIGHPKVNGECNSVAEWHKRAADVGSIPIISPQV